MSTRPVPPLLHISEAAARKLAALSAGEGPRRLLRVSLKAKGCAGMSYDLSWADAPAAGDDLVEDGGAAVLVDRRAAVFLAGSVMDYEQTLLSEGFVFRNPNETGRCGCGSSVLFG